MNRFFLTFFTTLSILLIHACSTTGTQTYVHSDKAKRYVVLYSNHDKRTTLDNPNTDRRGQSTIHALQTELKHNPRDLKSWLNLARLQVASHNLKEAEASARSALRLDLKNIEAKKILAQIAIKKGQAKLALILLNGLGGEKSRDSQVLNLLAQVAFLEGNTSYGMSLLKTAKKLDPENVAIRMNLGVNYLKYRQLNAAAIEFERVLKIMPENTDAKLHLAIIKTAQNDLSTAEKLYEDVLDQRPQSELVLFNLAVLKSRQEEYDEAIAYLTKYLKVANERSDRTDQAFALIDKIKTLQAQTGTQPISNEQIAELADELNEKDRQTQSRKTAQAQPATASKNNQPKSPEEREIEELEKALLH